MSWSIWAEVERALLEFDVKPIISVVPDNQDRALEVNEPKHDFWSEVRAWQRRGWTIGLHGYQHRYVTRNAGMVGINKYSEFSCLSFEEQSHKLQRSLEIFEREGVRADVWVAPGHSFDENTLKALCSVEIKYISDGLHLFPHLDSLGVLWVPQQLWRFRWMPLGVWTVCHHINKWTVRDHVKFRADLKRFRTAITSFQDVVTSYLNRRNSRLDETYARLHLAALRSSRLAIFKRLRSSS
jgi:predicted deacetylase